MKNIGVVPGVRLNSDLNWYLGEYFFTDTYVSRVAKAGGLPVGVIAGHGRIDTRILEHCDAFLLCGGQRILPYHLQVVDYAVTHHRPLLGVCLGMQAVHSYFIVREEAALRGWDGDLLDLYDTMKKERYYFVEPVPDHNSVNPASYAEENIHPVHVMPGSELAKYLPADFTAPSRHSYRITRPADCVTISAYADDGVTVEGIEYGSDLLAVQFHPELSDDFGTLFGFLTR